jgi:hypothetical protein
MEFRQPAPDGIVCFAGVDWWYHNRGHSECQIMRRLAERVPVLWINSIGMRLPTPGKTELPLTRYARKLWSTLRGLRRAERGLWIFSPIFIPRYSLRAVEWNGWLLHFQVLFLSRLLGIRRPSVFVTVPTPARAVARGRWRRIVFNRSDAFSEFPEVDSALISQLEGELLESSDSVLYVNRVLMEKERSRTRASRLLSHGVDFEHFSRVRAATGATVPCPERIAHLPRPLVGFYGALDDYTVDLELLVQTARRVRTGALLVIGPKAMEIDRLLAEPNVCYLGPVTYEELPNYAAHFDVGIMPWLQNDWIRKCNPIKLREYLALGFPIVSMRFPELSPYAEHVYGADSHAEFLEQLDRALAESDPARFEARRDSVRGESWESRAERVAELLGLPSERA